MACGAVRPQAQLHRFVLTGPEVGPQEPDVVTCDPTGHRPGRGRGAYACDAGCVAQAIGRRAFHRAFRRTVQIPLDLLESMNSG